MNRTSLTIKEAEEMINNMYEKKWENCEAIDKNAKLMGNIDNLELSNLEKASIVLLNEELRLKRENQALEQQLQQRDNIINYCKFEIKKEKDKFSCPLESEQWLKGRISAFEEILQVEKSDK